VQYPAGTTIIDSVGAILKVCTVIEETLLEFEIYYANILASIFIALCGVNIIYHYLN
jgi:hypothetical protein